MPKPKTHFKRQQLRAAQQIHEHLSGASLIGGLTKLPTEAWEELNATVSRLQQVTNRGWRAAARQLLEDLDYGVKRLVRELDDFRQELPQAKAPELTLSTKAILNDLEALEREFTEATIDLQGRSLSVLTEPVELEGTNLGAFRIVLRWDQIGRHRAYAIEATEPCPAEGKEEVTHPHVSDELLCEGEGAAPIKAALSQGRLLDFFTIVNQVLQTYNAESAHVALSQWDGVGCRDCGWRMPRDEAGSCDRCEETLCSECYCHCQGCDRYICSNCSTECSKCGNHYCTTCLTESADQGRLLCESCLEAQQESEDDCDDIDEEARTGSSPASRPADEPGSAE